MIVIRHSMTMTTILGTFGGQAAHLGQRRQGHEDIGVDAEVVAGPSFEDLAESRDFVQLRPIISGFHFIFIIPILPQY